MYLKNKPYSTKNFRENGMTKTEMEIQQQVNLSVLNFYIVYAYNALKICIIIFNLVSTLKLLFYKF